MDVERFYKKTRLRRAAAASVYRRGLLILMGQVLIRNLDDDVIETYRLRAKRKRHSLEQELRSVLSEHAIPSGSDLEAEAESLRGQGPMVNDALANAMLDAGISGGSVALQSEG